ncbi:MAG: DUF885 domain-containing protein, partial [Planctomycetota bacterium]
MTTHLRNLLALGLAVGTAGAQSGPATPAPSSGDRRLVALLDEDLEAQKRRSPVWAGTLGDRRFDAELPHRSEAAREAWLAGSRARLERLEAIDASRLSPAHRV